MNNYFMETHHHEWILTNKFGAYALGTGNLINQRKYHGLLVASDKDFNRHHLVAGMEEKVEWRGEYIHLDSNNYSNCIYPEGFFHLVKPWLRPYPAFLYSALPHQNEILIFKEIMMDSESNTTLVKYSNLGKHLLHFNLHPKFTMCPHHEINSHGSLDFIDYHTQIQETEFGTSFSVLRVNNGIQVFGHSVKANVMHNRYVFYNVYYPWEVMSGYEGIGDQISLFQIDFDLAPAESNYILFSDSEIIDPSVMIERIEARYSHLPKAMDFPKTEDAEDDLLSKLDYDDNILFDRQSYLKILEFALKDFCTEDDVVAGYPFYGPWGRDTMVVVNALLHNSDNLELAERILRKYSTHIENGLIPNMVAESGRDGNYDSIDATLWYIIMLWKVGKKKQSKAYWKEILELSESIIGALLQTSERPYRVREDGLIELDPAFAHGTWMDVRIDGKAVCPRWGCPVEINSLWYNALCAYEAICEAYNTAGKGKISAKADYLMLSYKVKESFSKFWTGEYLADRLEGDKPIVEIRPNAIIALSLPWTPVSLDIMKQVLERTFTELYTFYGIRTLSPKDSRFRKKYYGTQRERDMAYYNGSVWAWLFGPFCGLYMKVYGAQKSEDEIVKTIGDLIGVLRNSFMRGHIASVAEVWDGDHPHFPKGAPAQAWSVAALYNIETYLEKMGAKI
ncbi:MAG: amylo-alpha-1,6-glucosidase [Candidatus Cloacimonetes bacterium]|nr:amylo-alpha-1,6-glucosidase [Candidatus Cloacimonadota bacterium]MDD4147709.1 amylo-alpha-1,6-glucosidase [Candidatus Cloacimonadota bacterium]MDD4560473.1 amylo-alpha-1,6-glucosidase [Candidatus Cloacimonadota bacterium]